MGEGRYRLRLVTGGDRLTELEYFIRIPEAFSRRYEEMRSVNTAIGIAGSLAFLVLYGVGGMAIGLFLLGRQRWVIWKQPIFWGGLVAAAQTVATINEWPLAPGCSMTRRSRPSPSSRSGHPPRSLNS